MKIIIFGSSGFLGKNFINHNLKNDHFILSPTRQDLDLFDKQKVSEYIKTTQPDLIINCAGKVGGIAANINNNLQFLNENLLINSNVILSSYENKVKKLINFGSSCMYPKHSSQPMAETMLWSGELESTSLSYATAKIAAFQLGFSYNFERSIDRFLCVIPNSAYGPGDNFNPDSGHVLSALITKFHSAKLASAESVELWGTGNPMREFVFSNDIAEAVLFLLENDVSTATEPINIGSGHEISISNLASQIASIVGYEGKIFWNKSRPDGTYRKLLDSSKINALGWKASTSFEKGINETYSWYVRNQ